MKNAKKILLLVLSLVVLIGAFAVFALAEEQPTTATVVYPDGSEQTVAVGEKITPAAFENGFYKGKGNTLFKDDATEGWIFTVEGEEMALADLTVTEAMVGKKIIASGATKIYAHINAYLPDVDYTEWVKDKVYVMSGAEGSNSTKRVAGTYDIYFESAQAFRNFFTTGTTIQLGGVTLDYQDLRAGAKTGANTTYKVTIYEDMAAPAFKWSTTGTDRPGTVIPASGSYPQEGYVPDVMFDLNGHIITASAQTTLTCMRLYIFSTVAGGHWYNTSASASFYTSDDGTLYLGTNTLGGGTNADIKDNFTVHCATLFAYQYGSRSFIYGGHYYQTQTASIGGFVRISRRIKMIRDASFYVLPGQAVFVDPEATNQSEVASGTNVISGCTFYGTESKAVLYTSGAGAAKLKFAGCTFYGFTATASGAGAGTIASAPTEGDTKNTFNNAITYQSVTWADGTEDYYYATSKDAAKAYVESLPKAKVKSYVKLGKSVSQLSLNPIFAYEVDDAFNATQMDEGELVNVYFSIAITGGETTYYTDGATAAADLKAYMEKMNSAGSTVTMYADLTVDGFKAKGNGTHYFDLNGYTLTFKSGFDGGKIGWDAAAKSQFLYSSRPGGVIDASVAQCFVRSDDDGAAILGGDKKIYGAIVIGEKDASTARYYQNLTVYCKQTSIDLYGDSVTFLGGTYVQTAGSTSGYFILMGRAGSNHAYVQNSKNATFILTNPQTKPLYLRTSADRSFTNCTFISPNQSGVELNAYSGLDTNAKKFTFSNCNFVNVRPFLASAYIVYSGTTSYGTTAQSFFTTEGFTATDSTVKYLAHGTTTKTITANGVTYTLDGQLVTSLDNALKITFEKGLAEYWLKDTTPAKSAEGFYRIDTASEKYYARASYNFAAVSQMADGKVTAAGEANAPLSYVEEDLAFTYFDTKTSVLYGAGYTSDCGETAEGVFAKFYELFGAPASAYDIVMYKDMVMNKSVGFGRLIEKTDLRSYYYSLEHGNMSLDINGTTVTVSKDVKAADLIDLNAKNNGYFFSMFAVEGGDASVGGNSTNTLTIKSSKAGGKFINHASVKVNSTTYYPFVFGVAEGSHGHISIQGENITVESTPVIFYSQNATNDRKHMTVDGGTYIYYGSSYAVAFSGSAETFKNATVICKNNVNSVFALDRYRKNVVTIENCTLVSPNAAPLFSLRSSWNSGFANSALSVKDITLVGAVPVASVTSKAAANSTQVDQTIAVSYSGTNYASTDDALSLMYGDAAEGKVAAYISVLANGERYKVKGLYENAITNFVVVVNSKTETTERWLVGAEYVGAEIAAFGVEKIDGVWYYLANPVWVGKVDGVVVEGAICGAANAGETVTLELGGTLELLYYTVTVGGETTYYHGDSAISAFLNTVLKQTVNGTYEIKLYNDIETTIPGTTTIGAKGVDVTYKIDLNGYEWLVESSSSGGSQYAFVITKAKAYFYSSVEGGVLDVSFARGILCTDTSGLAYLGEPDGTSTAYGKNFTVKCRAVNSEDMWSSGFYIYGGTYVQTGATVNDCFLNNVRVAPHAIRNATFILNEADYFAYAMRLPTVTNCNIISTGNTKLFKDVGAEGLKISYQDALVFDKDATFANCNFYNIVPNTFAPITITYTDCTFNLSSVIPQAGGYIAYTGETLATVEALGTTYTFTAKLLPTEEVGIVNWGFGLVECYKVGLLASHDDVEIDTFFAYEFDDVTVIAGEQNAVKRLAAVRPEAFKMSLTLQSSIGLNLKITEYAAGATITVGGQTVIFGTAKDGYFEFTKFVSPDVANLPVEVIVKIGENTHVLTISVGAYAKEILDSSEAERVKAHNLTYAMIEYVRVMANDASFLADVSAPAGYAVQTLTAASANNAGTLLESLRFNLNGTIAVEIKGAEGKVVTLALASGRTEQKKIEGGSAIFAELFVNDFYGEMTISVEGEVYTYSLANYLKAMEGNAAEEAAIQKLHNYTYYADAYVKA